ncbi:FAD-dependent oxidoreductase [Candidatus Woesearchaeota archaeon]|nr:FAD-dependent oxidoreductase [Candidatus Woesearchaeota archaeon]
MPAITLTDSKKYFYLKNGKSLRSIAELAAGIDKLPDDVFNHHVSDKHNDFANWIKDVFNEEHLSEAMRKLRTRKQLSDLLKRFLEKGHFVHEVIIIGGGIAGMSAAVYAARGRMDYIIISPDFGGQMNVSGEIENYPGMAHTNFAEFQDRFREQMTANGIEFIDENVKGIKKLDDGHFFVITDKAKYESESIIVCTGARARRLNVPGETEFEKKGLTYCHVCDGPLFKNLDVAIVGGGDAALEAAAGMLRIARKLYLITINPNMTGHEYLVERVVGQEKVEVVANAKTVKIVGDKSVTGIVVEQNGKQRTLPVKGIIVEIGRIPNAEAVKGLCEIDADGHIMVGKDMMTSVPGIFAAGDCADGHEYQYAISAGQAVTALLKAQRYLRRR